MYTGASITESFSDKGSRNFGSSTTDYGYRARACNGVACSAWTATKTVTVTLAATTGFDSSYLVRSGNLGPDTDTDVYISPLAVGSGNVGEFILRNVGGTFTLESTPSTTDLAAAQQWTPSTQFEVRVEDINLDGTADAYVKGISGTISNAVDQIIVSSTTAGAAPVSIVSVDSDFKNFFTPIMAWYANPSHFDTRIITEGAWVLATATDIPALYTIAESTCIARWGNCRSRDGTLTSYYGSETDCVFALLAMGLTPTDIAGNPISRTVFCNRSVKAYFSVVVTTRTVRSFAGQLQKMAEFVTIWEAGEDRYGVEDLADVLEAVVGVMIGGYDFSHVENDDLDEADEQRVYEVHQALLNIWALLGERGRDRTTDTVYVTKRRVGGLGWLEHRWNWHAALEYTYPTFLGHNPTIAAYSEGGIETGRLVRRRNDISERNNMTAGTVSSTVYVTAASLWPALVASDRKYCDNLDYYDPREDDPIQEDEYNSNGYAAGIINSVSGTTDAPISSYFLGWKPRAGQRVSTFTMRLNFAINAENQLNTTITQSNHPRVLRFRRRVNLVLG